jgi:hypothetical protein
VPNVLTTDNYKARIYSHRLGRFMQTDPIGYADQNNLYGYVANDPVNGIDPSGTSCSVMQNYTITTLSIGKEVISSTKVANGAPYVVGDCDSSRANQLLKATIRPAPQSARDQQRQNCETSGINHLVNGHKNLADAVRAIRTNTANSGREWAFEAQNNGRAGFSTTPIHQGSVNRVVTSKNFAIANFFHLNFGAISFHTHAPGYEQELSAPDLANGDGFGEAMSVLVTKEGLLCSRGK